MAKFRGPLSRGSGRRGNRFGGRFNRFRRGRRTANVFTMSVDEARSYFFDRVDWDDILNPAELKALHFIGYILRVQARGYIRNRKKPSRPKSTPSNWSDTLKKGKYGIWNGVDPDTMTVYVGAGKLPWKAPHKLLGQPTVPAILEFGGRVWNALPAYPDPPRVRQFLPAGRVVKVQERPYMSKALKAKEKKILSIFDDMIGKSPIAMGVVNAKNAQKGG